MDLTQEELELIKARRATAAEQQRKADMDALGHVDLDSIKPGISREDEARVRAAIIKNWV